jgi:hypothetical protein
LGARHGPARALRLGESPVSIVTPQVIRFPELSLTEIIVAVRAGAAVYGIQHEGAPKVRHPSESARYSVLILVDDAQADRCDAA